VLYAHPQFIQIFFTFEIIQFTNFLQIIFLKIIQENRFSINHHTPIFMRLILLNSSPGFAVSKKNFIIITIFLCLPSDVRSCHYSK